MHPIPHWWAVLTHQLPWWVNPTPGVPTLVFANPQGIEDGLLLAKDLSASEPQDDDHQHGVLYMGMTLGAGETHARFSQHFSTPQTLCVVHNEQVWIYPCATLRGQGETMTSGQLLLVENYELLYRRWTVAELAKRN